MQRAARPYWPTSDYARRRSASQPQTCAELASFGKVATSWGVELFPSHGAAMPARAAEQGTHARLPQRATTRGFSRISGAETACDFGTTKKRS
jgi:hypothetical protein